MILYRKYVAKNKKVDAIEDDDDEKTSNKPAESKPTRSFLAITSKNATRCGLSIITGGIGAALGTLVRPGLGTVVGATIGDTISYAL